MLKKDNQNRDFMLKGSVAQALFRLGAPMVAGIVAIMAFNLVDTLFVAMLGDGTGPAAEQCASLGLPLTDVLRMTQALRSIKPQHADANGNATTAFTPHTEEILTRSIKIAMTKGRRQATPGDVVTAFFADVSIHRLHRAMRRRA